MTQHVGSAKSVRYVAPDWFSRFGLSFSFRSLLPLLLLAEGVLLGVALDSASLSQLPRGWWDLPFAIAPRVMPVSVSIAAAGLLLAGPRLRVRLRELPPTRERLWPLLLIHLACFAALCVLSDVIFNRPASASHNTGAWVAAWLIGAGLTLLSWLVAFAGRGAPYVLTREVGGLALGSVAVGVAAWSAGRYTQEWWATLRTPTLQGAYALLRHIDPSASADPERYLIGAGGFSVEISTECSGYEGVGLFWIFLGTFFWLSRSSLRFPHALILLPLGTAAILLANVARIAVLVLIGAHVSRDVAAGGFHSYAGVVLFCTIALLTGAIAYHVPFFAKRPDRTPSGVPALAAAQPIAGHATERPAPAAPSLLPFLATVATALVTGLVSARPFVLYPVQVAVAAAILWRYRHIYRPLAGGTTARGTLIPILIGLLVFMMWLGLASERAVPASADTAAAHTLEQPWRMVWLFFRIAGAVVIVPVVEELAFRGYLARRLMSTDFEAVSLRDLSLLAIGISSVLFGVLHGMPMAGILAGVAFAWAAKRRGVLADAVIAHAVANALLAGYVLMTGSWELWA
jgi:exosortase E/protease (VPEID-CTERM system)